MNRNVICVREIKRSDGTVNPDYSDHFSFVNDFSALLQDTPDHHSNEEGLL